jgi:hypothetical protein
MRDQKKFVEFHSEDDRSVVLRLSFERDLSGVGLDVFDIEIRAAGLSCDTEVLTWKGDGLGAFLSKVADDWRGWDGVRQWEAVERGMSIDATHLGSRVRLLFIVRRDFDPEAWEIRVPVFVAPGESLARLAKDTIAVLRAG